MLKQLPEFILQPSLETNLYKISPDYVCTYIINQVISQSRLLPVNTRENNVTQLVDEDFEESHTERLQLDKYCN